MSSSDTLITTLRFVHFFYAYSSPLELTLFIQIRGLSSFDVQYRASWSPLMEKLQPLPTINREVLLVGHIIGRDTARHMWIVEVSLDSIFLEHNLTFVSDHGS